MVGLNALVPWRNNKSEVQTRREDAFDPFLTFRREVDRGGSIGLLSAEGHPPYDRPPLSKKLWKGKPLESIWRQTESQGVNLHLGRTARHLDPQNKRITDDQGTAYGYGKLLLATGGTPRRLPFGGEQIIYFRTLDDYERLRALAAGGQRFAVICGGFFGSSGSGAVCCSQPSAPRRVTIVLQILSVSAWPTTAR